MSTWTQEPRGIGETWPDADRSKPPSANRRLQTTLRGMRRGIRGQSNFFVYFFFAALALAGAVALSATLADWCLLVLCIAGALTAEMFRSALAAVAGPWVEEDPRCAEGLEIAAGAVLIAVFTASVIAASVFVHRFGVLMAWWG